MLKDVYFEVREGEFVFVVGFSGSGKSTLCRALNGLIPHFYGGTITGRVTVDGQDIRNTPPAKLAGTVGMVFQDPENQLVMTNVENEMAFGMENIALPKEEMKESSLLRDYFDLGRFFSRFIPELSGGEKQKVALASVLAMRPKYIVLDEPTSQLDEETAALFLDSSKTEPGAGSGNRPGGAQARTLPPFRRASSSWKRSESHRMAPREVLPTLRSKG